jgi:hypothetical protein
MSQILPLPITYHRTDKNPSIAMLNDFQRASALVANLLLDHAPEGRMQVLQQMVKENFCTAEEANSMLVAMITHSKASIQKGVGHGKSA